jgi:protein tyrosine phosphatase (PTP) superfamily phosphohydrolase (DUF442 family)
MRFGVLQILLGVALVAAGPLIGGPAWALLWPGWSVLVVGLGYVGLGPRVLGKRAESGALAPWLLVLLFPYFAVAWTLWQIRSRLFSERAWDEVAPGLRLGRRPLDDAEIPPDTRCVVDLCAEFPRAVPATLRYVSVPTLDTTVPTDAELRTLLDTIAQEEGPIFVHCAMGRGRSATITAALLLRRGLAKNVDDAIAHLVQARPGVRLHPAQRAALERMMRASSSAR